MGIKEFANTLDTYTGSGLNSFYSDQVFNPILRKFRENVFSEFNNEKDDVENHDNIQQKCKTPNNKSHSFWRKGRKVNNRASQRNYA